MVVLTLGGGLRCSRCLLFVLFVPRVCLVLGLNLGAAVLEIWVAFYLVYGAGGGLFPVHFLGFRCLFWLFWFWFGFWVLGLNTVIDFVVRGLV